MGEPVGGVTHPRFASRRGGAPSSWWSKAFLRAVEEAAYATPELKRGRSHARAGEVGAITVASGSFVATVLDAGDAYTVTGSVPTLAVDDQSVLVELIAAEAGRIGALMSGDLPHQFVESVEEAGVELLPYGGELGSACTCETWVDPCPHALAVLTQLGWLIQRDPFVLFQLRGLPRDEVLARLHRLDDAVDDLAIAEEAALRAARELSALLPEPAPD